MKTNWGPELPDPTQDTTAAMATKNQQTGNNKVPVNVVKGGFLHIIM